MLLDRYHERLCERYLGAEKSRRAAVYKFDMWLTSDQDPGPSKQQGEARTKKTPNRKRKGLCHLECLRCGATCQATSLAGSISSPAAFSVDLFCKARLARGISFLSIGHFLSAQSFWRNPRFSSRHSFLQVCAFVLLFQTIQSEARQHVGLRW